MNLYITGYTQFDLKIFKNDDEKKEVFTQFLKEKIKNHIEKYEIKWVITGANLGIETFSLEAVEILKQELYDIKSAMIMPFANFGDSWNENNKLYLENLKEKVDYYNYTSSKPYEDKQQLINYQHFLLKQTQISLIIYDEEMETNLKYKIKAIQKYQEQNQDYEINIITFDEINEYFQEYYENKNI